MHNNHKMTEVRPKICLIRMGLICLIKEKDFQFGSYSKNPRICCTQEVELNKKIQKGKGIPDKLEFKLKALIQNEDKTLMNIYVYQIMQ